MLERLIMAIVLTVTLHWFLQVSQRHSQVNTSSHPPNKVIISSTNQLLGSYSNPI